jgi:septal ring factor EnvC (AmiA/AmiB activator)
LIRLPKPHHHPLTRAGRLLLAGLATFVVLAPLDPGWRATAAEPKAAKQTPAQKEAELRKVRERLERARKEVGADVQKRDKLSAELRKAELGVAGARKRLDEARGQRISAEGRLRDLQREQATRRAQLEAERGALAGELRAAYVSGQQEQLKLLLNQQDPAGVGRVLAYYGYFGRARAERIGAIRDKLAHLALLEEKIVAETERLRGIEADQERAVENLRGAQQQRGRVVASLDAQIKGRGDEIRRLQREAGSLEKLVAELRKALSREPVAAKAPFESLRGKLPWPVQQGKVLARYGQPRSGGPLKWQGMLIGTERGARVRAPFAGRVAYADWLPGMGLMVVVDHGKGYLSLYGHNEELFKSVGDAVSAGEVISSVGDSGGKAQPALYFEVRRGRDPVNPETWLAKR